MNFIKCFLVTLVIYIGLNAVFLAVSYFLSPYPLTDIPLLIASLFSPIVATPGVTLLSIVALIAGFSLPLLLTFLALIVPPLVAVIVGARLGETGKISFLSWFLTAVISAVVYLVLLILGLSPGLAAIWAALQLVWGGFIGAILFVVVGGLVNGIFYGCFSFLLGKGGI